MMNHMKSNKQQNERQKKRKNREEMKRIYKKNNDALLPTKLINVITENDYLREFQDFQLVAVYSFLEKEMKKKTEKVHTESDISPHSIDRFIYACTKSMFHEGNGMRMKKKET